MGALLDSISLVNSTKGKPKKKHFWMRLLKSIGLGLAAASTSVNDQLVTAVGGTRLCGYFTGDSVRLSEEVELDAEEGCIFKWVPEHDGVINIQLLDNEPLCEEGNMYIITDGQVHGPFCETADARHRRHADEDADDKNYTFKKEYSYTGSDVTGKDVDVVYTNDGGFRFRFNFNFEFELLPGKPGADKQEGFDEAVYGTDYKKPDPYKPEKPTEAPYKPTEAPYKPTEKPYKPKPDPYPKPTYKPDPYTTNKPYKPDPYKPTKKPYKPDPYPKPAYKPTYKPDPYTTKKPYKPDPYPKPTYKPGYKPPLYDDSG